MQGESAKNGRTTEVATLGGGCFWCLEAVFDELKGVNSVVSGYSGGHLSNPTYKQVSTGATGHAEVVQVTFDPGVISYKELLEVFLTIHDPTTPDRQGADVGTQYRSAVFYHSGGQRETALETVKEFEKQKIWNSPIVTEIAAIEAFYKAEDYHQEYFARNPLQPYCQIVIAPKVAKVRKRFLARLREPGRTSR